MRSCSLSSTFFFFNDTATTEIYTLSLHDALPISHRRMGRGRARGHAAPHRARRGRDLHQLPRPGPPRDRGGGVRVARVAVVGAGTMGHGIAYAAALGGCRVALTDSRADAVARALERIRELVAGGVKRGKLTEADGAAVVQRLRADARLGAAVTDAEVVIEAVVEDLAMKRRLFADLQDAAPHDALLATNTSSLSIAVIAQAVRDPARVLGLHFFNPVHAMRLVEVVTHERSDPGVRSEEHT